MQENTFSRELSTRTSAPGRAILFGEHALDFGEPAIALAVEGRAWCEARVASKFTVDGEELDTRRHAYYRGAILNGWTDMDRPLALTTGSGILPELGLGGLAAGTVACLGALSMLHDHIIFENVAVNAFHAHCEVEPESVPLDTSVSTHGGCVFLSREMAEGHLWTFKGQERTWHAHDVDIPPMELVLGYSGLPSPEADMRAKVERFSRRNSFARDILRDIGKVSAEGHAALLAGDLAEVGRLMSMNHRLLANLGVSNPVLDRLTQAASRHSFGAKLTGYGGGGCVLALARDADRVVQSIEAAGGRAHRLTLAEQGVRPDG